MTSTKPSRERDKISVKSGTLKKGRKTEGPLNVVVEECNSSDTLSFLAEIDDSLFEYVIRFERAI